MALLVEFTLHKDEGLGTVHEPLSLHLVRQQRVTEEVVEVEHSPVNQRVGLCRWILFKLHDLGVGWSHQLVSPRGWIGWTIIGLLRPFLAHRGLVLVTGEDTCWHWLSVGRCLHKHIARLVEAPWAVIEFEAIEFVLQPSNFLVVRSHLGVVTAQLLHDLVDDQLGVALDVEVSNAQLDGDV